VVVAGAGILGLCYAIHLNNISPDEGLREEPCSDSEDRRVDTLALFDFHDGLLPSSTMAPGAFAMYPLLGLGPPSKIPPERMCKGESVENSGG
jgi:hypothetical protein